MAEDIKNNQVVENEKPLVSVCIPVYNGEEYIRNSIESVLRQTYTNLELIISDNGCTDKSIEIAKSYNDSRVRIVKNNNYPNTMIGNFANCIKVASGKYVKILCVDDVIYETCVEKSVNAFENQQGVSVVVVASDVIDPSGKVIMKRCRYNKDTLINGKEFAALTFANARNYYSEPPFVMFRTSEAQQYDIYANSPSMFCVDWHGCLLLSYIGKVYYIAETLGGFRVSGVSTSVKTHEKRLYQDQIDFFKYHRDLGVVKLNSFDLFRFKLLVRLYATARNVIYKFKVK